MANGPRRCSIAADAGAEAAASAGFGAGAEEGSGTGTGTAMAWPFAWEAVGLPAVFAACVRVVRHTKITRAATNTKIETSQTFFFIARRPRCCFSWFAVRSGQPDRTKLPFAVDPALFFVVIIDQHFEPKIREARLDQVAVGGPADDVASRQILDR